MKKFYTTILLMLSKTNTHCHLDPGPIVQCQKRNANFNKFHKSFFVQPIQKQSLSYSIQKWRVVKATACTDAAFQHAFRLRAHHVTALHVAHHAPITLIAYQIAKNTQLTDRLLQFDAFKRSQQVVLIREKCFYGWKSMVS